MPSLATRTAKTDVASGLVGWWPFERTSFKTGGVGIYTLDESGYANLATQQGVGGITLLPGKARAYFGPNRIAASNPTNGAGFTCGTKAIHYSSAAYTYCLWISSTHTPSPDTLMSQANSGNGTTLRGHIQLLSSGKLRCQMLVGGVDKGYNGTGTFTYPLDGSWVHLAMTASSSGIVGYYNGAVDGTGTGGTVPTVSVSLQLANNGFGGGFQFPGKMDDCRIYNRALSQAEIRTIIAEAYKSNFDFVAMPSSIAASGGKFRTTLSRLGSRGGSRQVHRV